ncbi:MAG: hypothetical protein GY906_27495 [bacterium]|nr:hypothetical protein [bacterium]
MRRVAWHVIIVLLTSGICAGASPLALLRQEALLQERLLEKSLVELERHEASVQEAWVRVERLSSDLVRAQGQGESVESLRLRDEDLRRVEGDLIMQVLESQQLRNSIISIRAKLAEVMSEMRRLQGSASDEEDPITGTWRVAFEPGGMKGFLQLTMDGTLIQGTYGLEGGWSGSLRGTLVAGKVRLERIDSRLGYVGIFFGRLQDQRGVTSLAGRWEATELAAGKPSGGSWVAERLEPEEDL